MKNIKEAIFIFVKNAFEKNMNLKIMNQKT